MWYRYICLLLLLSTPLISGAQLGNFQNLSSDSPQSTITLNPSFPGPGEMFTATIEDYSGAIFGAQIVWQYNNEVIVEGSNKRSVELMAGAAGTQNSLLVELISPEGTTESISISVNPVYLDIIIEPQTRVPDWYIGRSLPSYTSQVNATALLHNGTDFLNPSQVVYSWRVDKNPIEGGAIRGGNKVSFETPRGSHPILVVTAADLQGNTITTRAVRMASVMPEIIYYEKHTLYGVSTLPIKSAAALIGNVLTMQAEPFNLDTRVYNRPDIAQWEINNIETDNGTANPYEITLSRTGTGGRTIVNFHVRSLQELLQGAEEQVQVNF